MKFIPEQFKLGSRTWDVVPAEQGTVFDEEGEEVYGLCDEVNAIITLEKGHPPAFALPMFMHELLHAIDYTLGLDDHLTPRGEELVDSRSGLLTQWLLSRKGSADLD